MNKLKSPISHISTRSRGKVYIYINLFIYLFIYIYIYIYNVGYLQGTDSTSMI